MENMETCTLLFLLALTGLAMIVIFMYCRRAEREEQNTLKYHSDIAMVAIRKRIHSMWWELTDTKASHGKTLWKNKEGLKKLYLWKKGVEAELTRKQARHNSLVDALACYVTATSELLDRIEVLEHNAKKTRKTKK